MTQQLRIVMFGTGDFALPTFIALASSRHQLLGLVTQPDRPQGRKQEITPSLIKNEAVRRGISVFQPESVNEATSVEVLRSFQADLFVTAAYGQILSAEVLGLPRLGGINLHGSILPRYRGAAPVARAIQAGETESGVTVIRMTPKIDAGGMIAVARTPIEPNETAGELEDRLARIGAPLILQAIDEVLNGTATVLPQDRSQVTKAAKLSKDDSPIDWSKPAQAVHNHVRAMQPWPIASTTWHRQARPDEPVRLIVHETRVVDGQGVPGEVIVADRDQLVVAAGSGAVRLLKVQIPGKKPLSAEEFLRGHRPLGDRLGN